MTFISLNVKFIILPVMGKGFYSFGYFLDCPVDIESTKSIPRFLFWESH